ncbi:MAG: Ldh family oxidoreductase [Candidatus Latescibacteria bacterium]|jgi:L-2-hydroxycarboxylate dehydrogenase (NAD+)|nr:Ldh family oxidoreductase [Candidatus Latescibacterota bacterium]
MKMAVEDVRDLSKGILTARGMGEDDAHIVTDCLLEAELRGRPTHGLIRLPQISERVAGVSRRPMRLAREGGAYALVDGQENLGYLVAHRCARLAVGKADGTGVGVVGAHNTSHCGMLGYYASMVADAGMVGLVMCDTSPRTVPWGGTEPVLGTNPISAAFPAGKGQVLVDLSTSAITNGQLRLAAQEGRSIPEGCAIGPDGRLTTDPAEARKGSVLPFGGHKGYALSVMVQIFSGALVRGAPVPDSGGNYGIFMLAISPSVFMDSETFQEAVAELVDRLKSADRAEGVSEILVPGERAFRDREIRAREGIEVDEVLLEALKRL